MQDDLQPMANSRETTGISMHSGFPNPAADNHGRGSALALDLNQLLIHHPSSTYLFRVRGEAWAEQGIFDNDLAIIDRALQSQPSDIVLTWHDEQFELCHKRSTGPEHHIWGVVSSIIHSYRQN